MRRVSQLLALGVLGSPAAAVLNRAIPQETPVPELAQNLAQGTSPRPTEPPTPRFGRMNLHRRLDEYTLGPGTCAFVASDGDPFTCVNRAATCSDEGGYLGCCEPNKECSLIKTTCIDYEASLAGDCKYPNDFHTLCCATSGTGSCFTFIMPTTGSDGSSSTVSALICSNRAAVATLLDYDPAWSATHIFGTASTSTTSSSTSTSTGPTPPPDNGKGTPVGAIVGGVVGGVAAISLVGVAAFLLIRRRRRANDATPPPAAPAPVNPQSPPTQMAQTNPTSPSQSFAPTTPGTAYPSGVPPSYQGFQQQGQPYDPNMAAYNQQGGFSPQQGYNTYSPPPQFNGQYAPPQQGQYNYAGGYQASSASPPPGVNPAPAKEGETPPAHTGQQSPPIQELDAVNPIGNVNNRAELG